MPAMPAKPTASRVHRMVFTPRSSKRAKGQGEVGKGLCAIGSYKSAGHNDGGILRDAEGALLDATDQGETEDDRYPVHPLRHPHGERR